MDALPFGTFRGRGTPRTDSRLCQAAIANSSLAFILVWSLLKSYPELYPLIALQNPRRNLYVPEEPVRRAFPSGKKDYTTNPDGMQVPVKRLTEL